jgi:hemerythrin-like domain-containing protein
VTDPIELLEREHRGIEEVLASLETFLNRLGSDPDSERSMVRDYASFFSDYVDTCHHGKEENYLFTKMKDYGFLSEAGPVAAMLSEQGEGREHLVALTSIGEGDGPLTMAERELVKGHGLGYILRIRPHIAREDDILFPMIAHSLPAFIMEEIGRDCLKFDQRILPAGFHENLRQLSQRLLRSYPPDKGRAI